MRVVSALLGIDKNSDIPQKTIIFVRFIEINPLNRTYIFKIMISYKDLGLVNSREIFTKAMKGGYAIPAFNFNNMEQLQAIIQACVETRSPLSYRCRAVRVSMPTRHFSDIWHRVP